MTASLEQPGLFIAQVAAIVLVARALGVVTRRLGQPMVVAEILTGILLGPSLLGLLWPDASATLFAPGSLDALSLVSEFGLVLFMFLVGVELDPKLLRQDGHTSAIISVAGVVTTFALGALLATYLHPLVAGPSVSLLPFTLFLGGVMTITAFPVLARILTERRLLRTRVGTIAITCAAVDDVLAWCLVAVVIAVTRAAGADQVALAMLLPVGFVAAMFLLVRPLLRWLGTWLGGRARLTHDAIAVFLVLLFASSWAAEAAGIHALFGAFLVGTMVPRADGLPHALAEKLEDLVLVVLMPLFFAYSGLRTEVQLLDDLDAWLLCGLILLIASLGKLGGNALAARLCGLSWRDSAVLGVLMNTRGLMALVFLNIGLDLGVISPTLFTMMVLVALATTLMASPLLDLLQPIGQLTRDLLAASDPDARATPSPTPDGSAILACVSEGATSGAGLITLAAQVRPIDAQSPVRALLLTEASDRASSFLAARAQSPAHTELQVVVHRAAELGLPLRPIAFVSAQPARDVCNMAKALGASLVLIAWQPPPMATVLLGGIDLRVLEDAPSTVGVLIDRGLGAIGRVLVPFVGTAHDRAALAVARRLADRGAAVTLLHVRDPHDPAEATRQAQPNAPSVLIEPSGSRITLTTVHSISPVDVAVAEAARGYDLVVVGVGREWGLDHRRLGVHSERFISEVQVSILVIRGPRDAAKAP